MPDLLGRVRNEVVSELLYQHHHREAHATPTDASSKSAPASDSDGVIDDDDVSAWSTKEGEKAGGEELWDSFHVEILEEMERVHTEMANHRKAITQTMSSLRKCQRKMRGRALRAKKTKGKTKTADTPKTERRRHGGVLKPCSISERLRLFMELPQGTRIARAEVTKYIHKYIKENKLQEGQFIVPNAPLSRLLGITDGTKLHMFRLPEKMNPHFIYSKAVAVAASDAVCDAVCDG